MCYLPKIKYLLVILPELIVTHILAVRRLLFTTVLYWVPLCHFYVVINQLGLFARFCSEYNSSLRHTPYVLVLCNADMCPLWGVVTHLCYRK